MSIWEGEKGSFQWSQNAQKLPGVYAVYTLEYRDPSKTDTWKDAPNWGVKLLKSDFYTLGAIIFHGVSFSTYLSSTPEMAVTVELTPGWFHCRIGVPCPGKCESGIGESISQALYAPQTSKMEKNCFVHRSQQL